MKVQKKVPTLINAKADGLKHHQCSVSYDLKTFVTKSEMKLMAVAPELSLTYLNNQTLKGFQQNMLIKLLMMN